MATPAIEHTTDPLVGLCRDAMPLPWGGAGLTAIEMMDRLEQAGYMERDAGRSFSMVTTMASTGVAVSAFGTDEQRERWVRAVAEGRVTGAHAITETESGSDALNMSTRAVKDGTGFVLQGTKSFVTNAGVADVYVVYARTSPTSGPLGLTAFLVPADAPGISVSRLMPTSGLHSAPVGELLIEDCLVGPDSVLGGIGRGFLVLDHVMKREILYSFMINVGEMRRRLDEVVTWARSREQYGQPIGRYQAVANQIVDMRIAMETSRLMLREAALQVDLGRPATAEIAMAKIVTSEANLSSAVAATKVFGGRGYLCEMGIEQHVRDALGGAIYSGSNGIQYNRVAAEMGLR